MNERLRAVRRGRPARASSGASQTRLPRRARRPTSTTRCARLGRRARTRRGAVDRPARQRRRGAAGARAPRRRGRRRDRPDERPRPAQRLRPGRADASSRPTSCARSRSRRLPAPRRRVACSRTSPRSATLQAAGAEAFDYGNALRGARRRPTATRTPSPTPASCPPTSGRCSARARGRSAGSALSGDPADIHATDEAILDLFGDQEHIARWIDLAARARRSSRACRRASAGSATASATSPGCASTRWSPAASCAAPIVIGRDHLDAGLGRLAPARDRGDARRLGRGRRLAAAQRAGQHRRAARRGCRSTTAAASAWASRSTPARCAWPTARRRRGERIRRVAARRPRHGHRAPRRRRLAARRSTARASAAACGSRCSTRRDAVCVAAARRGPAPARGRPARTCATTAPASCALDAGAGDARRRPDRGLRRPTPAPRAHRRHAAARCCPGFVDCHTHLPFAGWRAEEYEQKVTGVPYEEIARARRRDRVVGAGARRRRRDEEVLAQARGARGRDARARHDDVRGQDRLRAVGRRRARAPRASGRELGARSRRRCVTGLFAHAVPHGYDADAWMDEVERAGRARATSTRSTSTSSRSPSPTSTSRGWARSRAREGVPLRAHVEQFNANRSVPVALAAGARSVDHLACLHPDDVAPARGRASAPPCSCPAPSSSAPSASRRRATLADAGAICVLATDLNPGTSPVVLAAGDHRARRAPLRLERARGAARLHAQRGVGARAVRRARLARGRQARRRRAPRHARRARPLPLRAQPGVRWWSRAGEVAWVRPDAAWRIAS